MERNQLKCPRHLWRGSDCKHQRFNSNGHAILGLCEQAELVFLNGLEIRERDNFSASSAITREASSSVSDYILVSSGLLHQARAFWVDEKAAEADFSDHSSVYATFRSRELRDASSTDHHRIPRSTPVAGWAFLDKLAEDKEGQYARSVRGNELLAEAYRLPDSYDSSGVARSENKL